MMNLFSNIKAGPAPMNMTQRNPTFSACHMKAIPGFEAALIRTVGGANIPPQGSIEARFLCSRILASFLFPNVIKFLPSSSSSSSSSNVLVKCLLSNKKTRSRKTNNIEYNNNSITTTTKQQQNKKGGERGSNSPPQKPK
jgi:hypothetical protein